MNKRYNFLLPILFAVMMILGMLIGTRFNPREKKKELTSTQKFKEVLLHIDKSYIDTVDESMLVDNAIKNVISELDPHSYFISRKELTAVNQDLKGDFEGIGVEFNILNDTIIIVSPISGGPSEAVGIMAGDKIITIEGENVAGENITNSDVRDKLLGEKGTKVNIQVLRSGEKELLDFTITRDKIPLFSLDASYMVDDKIGYIKINRFSAKTVGEFEKAMLELFTKGMEDLILDLSGNPGGYLNAAFSIADHFFDSRQLIVYTEGRSRPRRDYYSTKDGLFTNGKLVIMIDEGSASASEIVAGAVQDWDRGLIIGRRSFGKGLVQEQINLSDQSAIRLTVAKYYTPSGRSIQKPYKGKNKDKYFMDVYHRYTHGELTNKDSIDFPDSLKYETENGRTVYGGGGIMPDIFVPLDTTQNTNYLNILLRQGLIYRFVLNYVDKNRHDLSSKYPSIQSFIDHFQGSKLLPEMIAFAEKQGVSRNNNEITESSETINTQIEALIARQLFGNDAFYQIINQINPEYLKAVEILHSEKFEKDGILSYFK